jgi:hypothetical protein
MSSGRLANQARDNFLSSAAQIEFDRGGRGVVENQNGRLLTSLNYFLDGERDCGPLTRGDEAMAFEGSAGGAGGAMRGHDKLQLRSCRIISGLN